MYARARPSPPLYILVREGLPHSCRRTMYTFPKHQKVNNPLNAFKRRPTMEHRQNANKEKCVCNKIFDLSFNWKSLVLRRMASHVLQEDTQNVVSSLLLSWHCFQSAFSFPLIWCFVIHLSSYLLLKKQEGKSCKNMTHFCTIVGKSSAKDFYRTVENVSDNIQKGEQTYVTVCSTQ